MHELAIAVEIIDAAEEHAAGARVRKVVVEVGALMAVLPDALRFSFEVAAEGSAIEGAALEVIEVPARATCSLCGEAVVLHRPYGVCACGSSALTWDPGESERLRIVAMELEVS